MSAKTDFEPGNSQKEPSLREVFALVEAMRSDFELQRSKLEQKITHLENELKQARTEKTRTEKEVQVLSLEKSRSTSRRRMLKKMVAGAAGVAVVGLATVNDAKADVGAGNLYFNGTGASNSINSADGTTVIQADAITPSVPLLTVNNTSSNAGTGSNPDSLPIGIVAKSNLSFGLYGVTTGSGTAPTGVIGVSSTATLINQATGQSTGFFSNQYGGTVGASDPNPGVVGLSQNDVGVRGMSSATVGVQGISEQAIGGAFATAATDPNQGAALVLGVRTNIETAPNPTAYNHKAGEFHVDRSSRLFYCIAGYNNAPAIAAVNPRASSTFFPSGVANPNGANWRILTPLAFRGSGPGGASDNELHVKGEVWWDDSAGVAYICTTTGAYNNNAWLGSFGLTVQNPQFKRLAGNPLTLLAKPTRMIDTRVNLNDTLGPYSHNETRTYALTSFTTPSPNPVPTYASGILANITMAFPPSMPLDQRTASGGFAQVSPNGLNPQSDPSTVNFQANVPTANAFTTALSNGSFKVLVYFSNQSTIARVHVIVDVIGYYV